MTLLSQYDDSFVLDKSRHLNCYRHIFLDKTLTLATTAGSLHELPVSRAGVANGLFVEERVLLET